MCVKKNRGGFHEIFVNDETVNLQSKLKGRVLPSCLSHTNPTVRSTEDPPSGNDLRAPAESSSRSTPRYGTTLILAVVEKRLREVQVVLTVEHKDMSQPRITVDLSFSTVQPEAFSCKRDVPPPLGGLLMRLVSPKIHEIPIYRKM